MIVQYGFTVAKGNFRENRMHVHILGICGTFMGGLAILGTELRHTVTGSDLQVYPPMSTQLEAQGIALIQGYEAEQLATRPDCVVVGNVMRRGMPVIEALLEDTLPMLSGPEWLAKYVLHNRHVLAVSGTHGKTTTSSLLAWILEYAGLNPGFLIGGVPNNFGVSARLGKGPCFVVEADEYDSAFFDKRSKFVHYRPRTLIINNIEWDHVDIFETLAAIQTQFHHLIRTVPSSGLLVCPDNDPVVQATLERGFWTPVVYFGPSVQGWHAKNASVSGSAFDVFFEQTLHGSVEWSLVGQHNISNALAAIAAAAHVGVAPKTALQALGYFQGVKRRLEIKGVEQGATVYDDFAHHPTAIATTLAGLRGKIGPQKRLVAVLDIRSNTMRGGHHRDQLADSLKEADVVYYCTSHDVPWDVEQSWADIQKAGGVFQEVTTLLPALTSIVKAARLSEEEVHVIFMSNGGFEAIHSKFLAALRALE